VNLSEVKIMYAFIKYDSYEHFVFLP